MRTTVRVAAPLAALLLAGCGAGGSAGAGPAPVTTSGSPSSSATSAAPASASSAVTGTVAAERVSACGASDVRTVAEPDGAGGVTLLEVRIVARPGVRCLLGGYPVVRVVARGGTVPVRHDAFVPGGRSAEPFVVRPGRSGVLELGWRRDRWCAPAVTVDGVEVSMPGGGTLAVRGFGRSACDSATFPGEHAKAPVSVSRFLPEQ
jgi:hypothetical protein